jgi:hypothetical protein
MKAWPRCDEDDAELDMVTIPTSTEPGYATWCVRKKRFGCAGGAAKLSRRLRNQ